MTPPGGKGQDPVSPPVFQGPVTVPPDLKAGSNLAADSSTIQQAYSSLQQAIGSAALASESSLLLNPSLLSLEA